MFSFYVVFEKKSDYCSVISWTDRSVAYCIKFFPVMLSSKWSGVGAFYFSKRDNEDNAFYVVICLHLKIENELKELTACWV